MSTIPTPKRLGLTRTGALSYAVAGDPTSLNVPHDPTYGIAKPRPLTSLAAAATRLTEEKIKNVVGGRGGAASHEGWQKDAWEMYDAVGELHFIVSTMAKRLGQARLFVGRLPKNDTEDVEPVTEGEAYDVFAALGWSPSQVSTYLERLAANLSVPGEGWLVGVPETIQEDRPLFSADGNISPLQSGEGIPLETFDWHVLSSSEVKIDQTTGKVTMNGLLGGREVSVNNLFMVRVWKSHPADWTKPDSPTRASLPVLRELVGLTMSISAQIDSRLAGAGVFFIPQEADAALRQQALTSGAEVTEGASPFVDALMEAMLTPISDRASAAAVVPIMPVVPGDTIDKFRYLSFASPIDAEARAEREQAIRRLALGLDCPPELLLGTSGMNHWGAWLVREDVVTTHLAPPLALICDSMTTQLLWPVLETLGMDQEEREEYVIWFSVDHLITRPNRTADAKDLHAAKAINDAALRDAAGFNETDAPATLPPAVTLALSLVEAAPSLMSDPGLPVIIEQIEAAMAGKPLPASPPAAGGAEAGAGGSEGSQGGDGVGVPQTADNPADVGGDDSGGLAASADATRRHDPARGLDPWREV